VTQPTNLSAFMLIPFRDKVAKDLYEHSTKPICKEFGIEINQSDEIFSPKLVLDDILEAIKIATIIIADLTKKIPMYSMN
jgi:hypothetical protein